MLKILKIQRNSGCRIWKLLEIYLRLRIKQMYLFTCKVMYLTTSSTSNSIQGLSVTSAHHPFLSYQLSSCRNNSQTTSLFFRSFLLPLGHPLVLFSSIWISATPLSTDPSPIRCMCPDHLSLLLSICFLNLHIPKFIHSFSSLSLLVKLGCKNISLASTVLHFSLKSVLLHLK